METVIKAFLGLFFMAMVTFTGVGILGASLDAKNADSFAADCVSKIESSHYAPAVINACKEDARNKGYELQVELLESNRGNGGLQRETYGTVKVNYEYAILVLGVSKDHSVYANMR